MKHAMTLAVGGVAIVALSLTGCSKSNDKESTETTGTSASASSKAETPAAEAPAGKPEAGHASIKIGDGEAKEVSGAAVCTVAGGSMNIAIGGGDTGVAAVVAEDGSAVHSVGLGSTDGLTGLAYQESMPNGGSATATKDDKTYTISGEAIGFDAANPTAPAKRAFVLVVTCP